MPNYIRLMNGGKLSLMGGGALLRMEQDPALVATPGTRRRQRPQPRIRRQGAILGDGSVAFAAAFEGFGTVGDPEDDELLLI